MILKVLKKMNEAIGAVKQIYKQGPKQEHEQARGLNLKHMESFMWSNVHCGQQKVVLCIGQHMGEWDLKLAYLNLIINAHFCFIIKTRTSEVYYVENYVVDINEQCQGKFRDE